MRAWKRYAANVALLCAVLLGPAVCQAMGGKVTYPDGSPAAGATVNVIIDGKSKVAIVADQQGRFTLPTDLFFDATIQIKAPSGTDFGAVALPAALFEGSDVAIVLQPAK